ncbi:MAG: hypothetical protein LAO21_15755 [Acidobacteriia bacterium]|nr:hypothetical protein [Terriglobia bacterium]
MRPLRITGVRPITQGVPFVVVTACIGYGQHRTKTATYLRRFVGVML